MRIVNPAFGLEEGDDNQSQAVDLSTDWNTDAIAIISNSKPNARELLGFIVQPTTSTTSSRTARQSQHRKNSTMRLRRATKGRLLL